MTNQHSAWIVRFHAFEAAGEALVVQHRHWGQLLDARQCDHDKFMRTVARLRRRFNESFDRIPTP